MTLDSDLLVDRRRLRRKLTLWRALAALALVGAVLGTALFGTRAGLGPTAAPHIARVRVEGLITGDRETLDLLDRLARSNASAVIVSIDSPGGTASGAEALHEALRRVAEKKPTAAVIGSLAASGGYVVALATDRVFARQNALVGSIGTIIQYPDATRLLDQIGVRVEAVRSSPLKAQPNGLEPVPPEAREALQALIGDSFAWFRDLVRTRRSLDEAETARVADGRVFTGRQAIGLKLVDALGGEREAIAWLEAERGVAKDLRVRDWRRSERSGFGLWRAAAALAHVAGLDEIGALLRRAGEAEEIRLLDGVLALWRPAPPR